MNKMPLSRLSIALGLAMSALPLHAASPPDDYAKQIWMDETLTNVIGNDTVLNSVKADQSGADSGLIDVYQNGEGNQAGTTIPGDPSPSESPLRQEGSGNTLRIGQGATYVSAAAWAERWVPEPTAVSGNVVNAYQTGSNNTAEIYQLSDGNEATVNQQNTGNLASINQAGSGYKKASISQSGVSGAIAEEGHVANITQNDSSDRVSTATITQTGSVASTADVTQTGSTRSSTTINQSGTAGHQATVYQNGGELIVNQTGSAAQNLRLGNPQYAARFSNQGLTVTQSAGGPGNTVDMSSQFSVTDPSKGVYGTITQTGEGSTNLRAMVEVTGLTEDSGVFIKQTGTGNKVTAGFSDSGGVIDIEQANGAEVGATGSNNIKAAVSGGAEMVINQEGSGNAIDAEMSGGYLYVGSTAHSSGGGGSAGQTGSGNRMVVRGTGGTITASQAGSGNKMHLGTGLMGSSVTYDASGDITAVTATAGGGVTGGSVSVTQTGTGNLINVATTTPNADLSVTQSGGARADLNTVSSAVTILQ